MKKICKIILLDEVNCILTGLTADHYVYFFEEYGIFTENYYFSPKNTEESIVSPRIENFKNFTNILILG